MTGSESGDDRGVTRFHREPESPGRVWTVQAGLGALDGEFLSAARRGTLMDGTLAYAHPYQNARTRVTKIHYSQD